ncbi:hypothetical protein U0038_17560 [Sphingobacterium spiritivorum]|uniref:Uncharacterized protein n=1 Tax=Sphingobacterium spiritivorum ATCC 33861 TaxID=525373 RepID=D7VN48_SPHSI|nr:hypothetical protein [Sphingobacterium spiritivorum]EFK57345.1 hypothetical protein HMPREF0766_12418 [Sphingobacterium spiritivorum ATCC 33861]QQT36575.1 hypothetical protein I6J01_03850 [Sphingobacterium spiritivorum]WQD33326.1 hypothetical protein U0038_17560 [Sphingobacterium spiritivorum]SUJ22094.1 Uncharacterised protein [Sphingobacterium spiritivorum]
MTERELLLKIRELNKALDDYKNGWIKKEDLDWGKEILSESKELMQKSHTMQTGGTKCGCCGGSGTA